jgi:hypothetical protein
VYIGHGQGRARRKKSAARVRRWRAADLRAQRLLQACVFGRFSESADSPGIVWVGGRSAGTRVMQLHGARVPPASGGSGAAHLARVSCRFRERGFPRHRVGWGPLGMHACLSDSGSADSPGSEWVGGRSACSRVLQLHGARTPPASSGSGAARSADSPRHRVGRGPLGMHACCLFHGARIPPASSGSGAAQCADSP